MPSDRSRSQNYYDLCLSSALALDEKARVGVYGIFFMVRVRVGIGVRIRVIITWYA